MMNFISQHKIAAILVLVLLIGAAWYGFTASSAPAPVLSTTDATDTNPADQSLVSTLLQLQAVSLSGNIFSDPAFTSLQDFTTQIVSEPIGRTDPFAPLSPGTIGAASSSTTNTHLFAPAKH